MRDRAGHCRNRNGRTPQTLEPASLFTSSVPLLCSSPLFLYPLFSIAIYLLLNYRPKWKKKKKL